MDNLKQLEPSYIYKSSGWLITLIASVIGCVGLFFVLKKIYQTDFTDLIVNFNFGNNCFISGFSWMVFYATFRALFCISSLY